MESVSSHDGTRIAYRRRGAGPPLVLVHGMAAANPADWPAAEALSARFTLYGVDRRGRRASGDGSHYALAREAEDVAAVVDAIGRPAFLLGHSFGGLCALEAALLTPNVRKLVLYEPASAPAPQELIHRANIVDKLQKLLDAGDEEAVILTFYQDVAGLSPDAIAELRNSPLWPDRLAAAPTIVREIWAAETYTFDATRFDAMRIPTLLLLGGDSPEAERRTTETLHASLPNSQVSEIPGKGHLAMYTAPELFAKLVADFLEA
jgi:pimeloyl-ACP methyl ester carboxylesterase